MRQYPLGEGMTDPVGVGILYRFTHAVKPKVYCLVGEGVRVESEAVAEVLKAGVVGEQVTG